MDFSPGSLIQDRYEIVREIGRGGFSIVFEAIDRIQSNSVAVKLLVPPPASAELARARMKREVKVVRALQHPHIAQVYDFIETGPWTFIILQYLAGGDLYLATMQKGALSAEKTAIIGEQIGSALVAAHRQGILHRDIKPQNILLDQNGNAYLTDFGSARMEGQTTMTRTGAFVGTIDYVAPEIIAGQRADARSDLYSLGLTLYFTLTGRLPVRSSPHVPLPSSMYGHFPRAVRGDVPSWLNEIVAQATRADPSNRFPTGDSLAKALTQKHSLTSNRTAAGTLHDPCIICGAPDPFGAEICRYCQEEMGNDASDTLLFLKGESSSIQLLKNLKQLLPPSEKNRHLIRVIRREQPLARINESEAPRVLERLKKAGIPADSVPASQAWTYAPKPFLLLLIAALGAGIVAGVTSVSAFLYATPLICLSLLIGAHKVLQKPFLNETKRESPLPEDVRKEVLTTFRQLPEGTSRKLLTDMVRLSHDIFPRFAAAMGGAEVLASLRQLLSFGEKASLNLKTLEDTLTTMETERSKFQVVPLAWMQSYSHCERARDTLVQHFLEGIASLIQAQNETASSPGGISEHFSQLAAGFRSEVQIQVAVQKELDEIQRGV